MDYPPPKKREPHEFEDEPIIRAELCIRVAERVTAIASERRGLDTQYFTLFGIFQEVIADELQDYAFDLAYHLFSRDESMIEWRAERVDAELLAQAPESREHGSPDDSPRVAAASTAKPSPRQARAKSDSL